MMINNFLLPILYLCIFLIGLDIAFYLFRRKKYDTGTSILGGISNTLSRIVVWVAKQWQSKFPLNTDRSNPKSATDNPISTTRLSKSISVGSQRNPVHVEISADIPEGITLQFTLKTVNTKGKTTSQKGSLAHEIRQVPAKSLVTTKKAKSPKTKAVDVVPNVETTTRPSGLRRYIANLPHVRAFTFRQIFQHKNMEWILLISAIAVYAVVISFGIDRFPIYFFTDEAIHMNMASDFIRDHFRNYDREFLPTFFISEVWVNGVSVYVQVLPYLLFGKSVVVTRLVSASITLVCALSLGLLLKQVFKIKYHWAGVLLLLTTPAWFFHARTAFEYAEVASFYMIFLYFYSRYRDGHLQSLYGAIFAGALAFYTHGLGQVLMTSTGLALFIIDFRYHIHPERRRTFLFGLGFSFILFLPFVRYYLAHSDESFEQIERRASYWYSGELTTPQKMLEFFSQYISGLNPLYWYFKNPIDIARHVMKDYGNGLLITLPFALLGFFKVIKNLRQSAYHVVLIAFLAAPIPGSIIAVGMPRMLWMAIPIAIFTSLGFSLYLEMLESHWKKISTWLPWMVFTLLSASSIFMLRDALVNGPTWFDNYGLYGMQYGAQQVFAETIKPELEENPDLKFVVSPSWANGTDEFADFFIPKDLFSRVSFGQPENRLADSPDILAKTRFVLPTNEYDNLLKNPKFKNIAVHRIIPYPDGQPGFYVVSVSLADNLSDIIEAEKIKNRTPVEDIIELNGQEVRVLHSPIDSGGLIHVFDNNPNTLVRVLEANPFIFDLYPPTPMDIQSIVIQTGSLPDFTVTISLYAPDATIPQTYTETFKGLIADPIVTMAFDKGPAKSSRIYIEIKDNLSGETSQIHVRQIEFR